MHNWEFSENCRLPTVKDELAQKNHEPSSLVNARISDRKSHLWWVSAICNTYILELLQPFLCWSLFLCCSGLCCRIKGPAFSFLSVSLFPFSLYFSLCLYVAHGVGVFRQRLPTSLCRSPDDGPGFPPTVAEDLTMCVARALVPTLAA